MGDRDWHALLDAHDAVVRVKLACFRSREVNTSGDGFLAMFDGPQRAIRCAMAIRNAVQSLGIQVRAGLHTGECEVRGDDIGGIGVHIGARVSALARPNEVLVSSTLRDLVIGSGLEFEERDVWGKTREPDFLAKDPAHLTPMLEEEGLPRGALGESCAIMAYLSDKHGLESFYPRDTGQRAVINNAMFYLIGTFYPLLTRATYPALGFPQYPGEVATSEADDEMKAKAQKDAEAALAEPLEVFRSFFLDGKPFIGGDAPSIADIRLAATLEFLRAIDYEFPAWAEEFMQRMEETLGEAYSEPAADVRGYVESVKSAA